MIILKWQFVTRATKRIVNATGSCKEYITNTNVNQNCNYDVNNTNAEENNNTDKSWNNET